MKKERLIAESDLDSDVGSELLDDGPIENEGDLQIKKMTEEILSQIISNEGHNMGQRMYYFNKHFFILF